MRKGGGWRPGLLYSVVKLISTFSKNKESMQKVCRRYAVRVGSVNSEYMKCRILEKMSTYE
jgi:hypothetical protein